MRKLICLIVMSVASCTALFADAWITNYNEALARAKVEDKYVLADFTGSDWCCWCKKLDKEVFARGLFEHLATNDFVLLRIDFPKDKLLSKSTDLATNRSLAKKYGVTGFPTVLILDEMGNKVATTGYKNGGVARYVVHLYDLIGMNSQVLRSAIRARVVQYDNRRIPMNPED